MMPWRGKLPRPRGLDQSATCEAFHASKGNWHPAYWVSGVVKAVTAAASVPILMKLMPEAWRWPSPAVLKARQR